MKTKDLIVGDHYYTVLNCCYGQPYAKLVEVELLSTTGQDRPMNCVVKDVESEAEDPTFCISSWLIHKDKQSAICQALIDINDDIQNFEEGIDDLMYKLRSIRENQSSLLQLLSDLGKQEVKNEPTMS